MEAIPSALVLIGAITGLNLVAVRCGVSASWILKIQDAIEATALTPQQQKAMERCKVKQ